MVVSTTVPEAARGWSQSSAGVPPPPLTIWSVILLAGLVVFLIGLVVALANLGITAVLLLLVGMVVSIAWAPETKHLTLNQASGG